LSNAEYKTIGIFIISIGIPKELLLVALDLDFLVVLTGFRLGLVGLGFLGLVGLGFLGLIGFFFGLYGIIIFTQCYILD